MILTVLNLPQLYQHPSAFVLLGVLDDLSLVPPSWSASPAPVERKIKGEGVPSYLTKIISSPLTWIEDDAEKEVIWETAAQRLSERSGRTGMGNISRVFSIPLTSITSSTSMALHDTTDDGGVLDITLYEPAMSEDNLGLKTWAASFLLAKRLPLLLNILPPLGSSAGPQILELGSGTGLVGLAAAAVFKKSILLTDLPAIVPNLDRNIQANEATVVAHGGRLQAATLDWTKPNEIIYGGTLTEAAARSFGLIFAADPIYSSDHPGLLVNAISHHLSQDPNARLVIELPLREAYADERQDLKKRLSGLGLQITDEGEEIGYDDWVADSAREAEGELAEVKCWWGVWRWR